MLSRIHLPFVPDVNAFLKRRRGYCNRLRPSFRLSVMLSPKPFDEIQLLVCEFLTRMGRATAIFWGARPLGPWGGVKKSNIFYFQLQSQFQRFLYQTLCVFSQMKDTKHIRRDFHSVGCVMPKGSDLGSLVVPRGSFF